MNAAQPEKYVALWVCNAEVCGNWMLVPAGDVPDCDLEWGGHRADRSMRKIWEGHGETRTVYVVGSGDYEQWGPDLAFENEAEAEAVAEAWDRHYTAGDIQVVVRK